MLKIEGLLLKDIEQIHDIECACFSTPWSINTLMEDLSNSAAKYIVLKDDDEVLGYLGVRMVLDELHIMNVAVKPDKRGKGYSNIIMDELMTFAVQGDYKIITLEVRESNEVAMNLYLKFGFERCGMRRDYYEKPKENAVLMVKYM